MTTNIQNTLTELNAIREELTLVSNDKVSVSVSFDVEGELIEAKGTLSLVSGCVESIENINPDDYDTIDSISIFVKQGECTKAYDAYIGSDNFVEISTDNLNDIKSHMNIDSEIKETIYTGDMLASIIPEAEGFKEYNSVRFWTTDGEEIFPHDLKMVIYQDVEEELNKLEHPIPADTDLCTCEKEHKIDIDWKSMIKKELAHQIEIDTDGKLSIKELIDEAVKASLSNDIHGDMDLDAEKLKGYIIPITEAIKDVSEQGGLMNFNIEECEVCVECETVMLPNDECYEKHDGESLCSKCSIMCESCDSYFVEEEGVIDVDNLFCCLSCLPAENIDFYTHCEQADDNIFIAGVTLHNRVEDEYITYPEQFEFKTMKEAELFASEAFKIKTAKIQDVKDLYKEHTSMKSTNINVETKEDFIESVIHTADYGEDIIEILIGSNKYAVVGDDKAVYFNSHNEEKMKFKTIQDFASWYYENNNTIVFDYQIPLGFVKDGVDCFYEEELSEYKQDKEEDGDSIWSECIAITDSQRKNAVFPRCITLKKIKDHLEALDFTFAQNLHTDATLTDYAQELNKKVGFFNREDFINFIIEKTEWSLCDRCGVLDKGEKLWWEKEEWGDIGNYVALCDSCNEKTIKEYANTLNYFHPLTQECKIISFPESKHYLLDTKNLDNIFGYAPDNIFGYAPGSMATIENAHGNTYEVEVETIERFTHWHSITVNGKDYNYELYNGAIDEMPKVYSHILLDDGENERDMHFLTKTIDGIDKNDLVTLPRDTVFTEDGIMCYVWNNDSSEIVIDIVYTIDEEAVGRFQTFTNFWDNASEVHHGDKEIKLLVSQLIEEDDEIREFVAKLEEADVISIYDGPLLHSWDLDDERGDLISTTWYEDDNEHECYISRDDIEKVTKKGKTYTITTNEDVFHINLAQINYL